MLNVMLKRYANISPIFNIRGTNKKVLRRFVLFFITKIHHLYAICDFEIGERTNATRVYVAISR